MSVTTDLIGPNTKYNKTKQARKQTQQNPGFPKHPRFSASDTVPVLNNTFQDLPNISQLPRKRLVHSLKPDNSPVCPNLVASTSPVPSRQIRNTRLDRTGEAVK